MGSCCSKTPEVRPQPAVIPTKDDKGTPVPAQQSKPSAAPTQDGFEKGKAAPACATPATPAVKGK